MRWTWQHAWGTRPRPPLPWHSPCGCARCEGSSGELADAEATPGYAAEHAARVGHVPNRPRPQPRNFPLTRDQTSAEVGGLQWNGRGEALHAVPVVPVRLRV